MKKNLLLALALLIPVVIAGCIGSGTIVFVFDFEGLDSSDQTFDSEHIILSENSDYEDNKDKLKSVDAITLVGYIINHGTADVMGEAWISDNLLGSIDEVRNNGTLIFESPVIPAGDSIFIDWSDGMEHIRNFAALEEQLKGDGDFYLYGIASGSFHLEYQLNLIVTITAGL